MAEIDRLRELLGDSGKNAGAYGLTKDGRRAGYGSIPLHYKRITLPEEEQRRLARVGTLDLISTFGMKLYYTQAVISGAILSGDYDKIAVITPSQYGKLIADEEPVLTRKGWKRHGDLLAGDEVISPDGKFVKVTYVHPKGIADRIVTFRNGIKVKCHHRHEWRVWNRDCRRYETVETDNLRLKTHKVVPISPVIGEEKELAVHPYVLGVWLGDGATTKGQIHSSKQDIAVLDRVREFYPKGSEWVHKDTGVITRSFNGLSNDLSAYGMCYETHPERGKYIPDDYLTASIEQRLQLLAGLIDTDGYRYERDGRFYYSTTSAEIKDGVEALVSTFGWGVSVVKVPPHTSKFGIEGRKDVYQIGFNPSLDIPCVLERKRPARLSKQRRIGVVSVEEIEPVSGNCITVEGGLYCVGKRLIPTHNSHLMGAVALLMAYRGRRVNVAAGTTNLTGIIMRYCRIAASRANSELKKALTGEALKKVDRLDQSLSKDRLAFANKGMVQGITLGDTFAGTTHNMAVGQGGAYIVDEAAAISSEALMEIGRREFSTIDGSKEPLIMISNPHNPGYFYDFITQEELAPRECVIWMDALTACQEERWTPEKVLTSEFSKHTETLQKYLLCELPSQGAGMFGDVKVGESHASGVRVMGVDAAYKGKDSIEVCLASIEADKVYFEAVEPIKKTEWIDGVTSKDIIEQIARVYHATHCEMCCIDVGFGVWLVEGLLYRGVNAKGVNFGAGPTKERVKERHYSAVNASNRRAEMHLDLQDIVDNQACLFSPQVYERIRETLPLVISERKQGTGKVIVVPKPEIKAKLGHSPDAFDAVLLALHAAILYSGNNVAYLTEGDDE